MNKRSRYLCPSLVATVHWPLLTSGMAAFREQDESNEHANRGCLIAGATTRGATSLKNLDAIESVFFKFNHFSKKTSCLVLCSLDNLMSSLDSLLDAINHDVKVT